MDIDGFADRFDAALERAALSAQKAAGSLSEVPNAFEVYAPHAPEGTIDREAAISLIYLDDKSFFKIIDIAVLDRGGAATGFVRVSGHAPVPFEETYDPSDLGPFKILSPTVG